MKILIADVYEAPESFCSDRCSPVFTKNAIASISCDGKSVSIWKTNDALEERISLIGHERKINTLGISPKSKNFLCTCSEDKIILWNLKGLENNDRKFKDSSPQGVTFAFDAGYIEFCTFSWDDKWLALCREREILIIKIKWTDECGQDFDVLHHSTVETNSGHGNLCAFSPLNEGILVTVEVNCYFKVWNLRDMTVIYRSPKLGMHIITHCSFAYDPTYLLLGTSGGTVHVYSLKDNNIPTSLLNVDVGKTFQNYNDMSKNEEEDSCQKLTKELVDGNNEYGEIGCVTFGVYLLKNCEVKTSTSEESEMENSVISEFFRETDTILKAILAPSPIITVCCNLGIAFFNCNSWECETIVKTFDMFSPFTLTPRALPLLSFLVIDGETLDDFSCILKMSFNESKIRVLKLQAIEDIEINKKGADVVKPSNVKENKTSVIPLVPVHKSSPLRFQMSQPSNSNSNPYVNKNTIASNKIKSSGYGRPPRIQLFQPVLNRTKNLNLRPRTSEMHHKKIPPTRSLSQCSRDIGRQCFAASGPPINPGSKHSLWDTMGTMMKLDVTSDGEYVACCSNATYMYVLQFSDLDPEKGFNLFGHNGALNSLHFSMNSQWLVSASCDTTAKVWDWKHRRCILDINFDVGKKKTGSLHRKEVVKNSILRARFYYMDQFILTATQDRLELFSHLLHDTEIDKKNKEVNKTKRVWKMNVPVQQITAFTAANQFYSYLVLCCCSNRSLQVFDLNAEKCIVEQNDIHSRPAHHIKQMEGSQAVAHSPAMYNLFVTSSVCDSVKLWDMRTAKCVQKFCQHLNRAYTSGIDISPCGCYIAASSEDKYVYLYDSRKCGDYITRLGGLGDVVTDVAFNPRKPMLAAAALNGWVMSYTAF